MGPQGGIDLFRAKQLGECGGRALHQRAELQRLGLVELPDVCEVSLWLDDQRADAERPDAMLHHPVPCFVDQSPGQLSLARGQFARQAAVHRARI